MFESKQHTRIKIHIRFHDVGWTRKSILMSYRRKERPTGIYVHE